MQEVTLVRKETLTGCSVEKSVERGKRKKLTFERKHEWKWEEIQVSERPGISGLLLFSSKDQRFQRNKKLHNAFKSKKMSENTEFTISEW